MTDATKTTAALYAALARAQAAAPDATPDAENTHHRYAYASAEQMIALGRACLAAEGLALLPTSTSVCDAALEGQKGQAWAKVVRSFVLAHAEGGATTWSVEWVFAPDRGRPWDKALAAALTSSLAYVYRDVLGIRRDGAEGDDIAARDDTGAGRAEAAPRTTREDVRRLLGSLPGPEHADPERRSWLDAAKAAGVDAAAAPLLTAAALVASNVHNGRAARHGLDGPRLEAFDRACRVMGGGWYLAAEPVPEAEEPEPGTIGGPAQEAQAVTLARLFAEDPDVAVESARVILEAGKAEEPALVEALAAVIAAGPEGEIPEGVDDETLGAVDSVLEAAGITL